MLTLSRVEAGREVAHPERMPVFAALHEASIIAEPLALDKRLDLRVLPVPKDSRALGGSDEAAPDSPQPPHQCDQVHRPGLGGAREPAVRDGCVEIMVRDTGIGIAPANHDRIFDTFWQVEQKSTRKVGGAGLGLSVSRRLARLMGGDLTVQSKLGEGSTFTIRLPARGES